MYAHDYERRRTNQVQPALTSLQKPERGREYIKDEMKKEGKRLCFNSSPHLYTCTHTVRVHNFSLLPLSSAAIAYNDIAAIAMAAIACAVQCRVFSYVVETSQPDLLLPH